MVINDITLRFVLDWDMPYFPSKIKLKMSRGLQKTKASKQRHHHQIDGNGKISHKGGTAFKRHGPLRTTTTGLKTFRFLPQPPTVEELQFIQALKIVANSNSCNMLVKLIAAIKESFSKLPRFRMKAKKTSPLQRGLYLTAIKATQGFCHNSKILRDVNVIKPSKI